MNADTKRILYSPEVPRDLFSLSSTIPVYDIEKKASTGEEVTFHSPYNAVDELWLEKPEKKALVYLYERLKSEGYVLWIPQYRGERFSLLAEKGGRRFLIYLCLESEDERKVWLAKENSDSYTVVIIRDMNVKESGAHCVSLDSALDSFNFLSL